MLALSLRAGCSPLARGLQTASRAAWGAPAKQIKGLVVLEKELLHVIQLAVHEAAPPAVLAVSITPVGPATHRKAVTTVAAGHKGRCSI